MRRNSLRRLWTVPLIAMSAASAVAALSLPAVAAPVSASAAAHSAPQRGHAPAGAAAGLGSWAVPHSRAGRVKPGARFGAVGVVPHGDEIITASADTGGYHLFAASSGGSWRWQPLATLQPVGYHGERWIGEQCLTGDGRYVVAVVAPWSAQNSAAGMAAGGTAYVIDAHTGRVRPLAAGVAVTYFDPGCGVGASAALTRFTADESRTQVLLANLGTGAVSPLPVITGELTSAVPAGREVLAARGSQLMAVSQTGAQPVATLHGQVFSLRPDSTGGADFIAEGGGRGSDPAVGAFSWSPSRPLAQRLRPLGQGGVHQLRLYAGSAGHNLLLGASGQPTAATGAMVTRVPVSGAGSGSVSLDGQVILRAAASLVHPVGGAAVTGASQSLPAAARPVTQLPATAAAGGGQQPARVPSAHSTSATTAHLTSAVSAARPGALADPPPPTATCAVPRLSDGYQVPQPSSAQIEWVAGLAGSGRLYSVPGNLRPAGFDNLPGNGWDPSGDFGLPLSFGPTGKFVPKEILDGIMAQESNWNQASPHAPQGLPGAPYIADYYGYNHSGTIDYPHADCGYGLGQITDGMSLATGQSTPTSLQQRVAVDYAENVAAAAQTLANKWIHLQADGITVDTADPAVIEDWYFAVWAYNSGINPQASTGNTTGCPPGPGCTDSAGNWGLGWTNNPANPVYNPGRDPFLHLCLPGANPGTQTCGEQFQDAASPQGWPYQEKVFGWIETPLTEPDGFTPRYPGTFDYAAQTGFFLAQPAHDQMCDSSDQCNYAQAQPCAHSAATDPLQWHCWWNKPITGVCTANPLQPCNPGHTAGALSAEPTVADPFPATCTNSLPADTVLIDDGSVEDVSPGLNLAGCPQASQSNGGNFSWHPNFDTNLQPIGLVDLHQLGTGYGGHMLFTHLEDPAYKQWGGTAEWDLTASYDVYDVAVFVPGLGAAGTLSYTIYDGRGNQVGQPISVDQNNYTNQWVNLGRFYLGPGAKVTTTNIVPGGDGTTDVAFDAVAFSPVASYAALGDSYSSGVGVGSANYDLGTNTATNQCLRSGDSYARQYGTAHGYPGVLTVHLACSGAVIDDLTNTNKYLEPGQINVIPKHARLVTVTIGGNDAGFADVVKQCLTPDPAWKGCEKFYTLNNSDNVDAKIQALELRLEAAYNEIRAAAPTATIVALTYPSIFAPTSVASCVGPTALGLPAQDIEWLISETNNLDNQVEIAAHRAGIQALDERYAFANHEVCAPGSPDVNNALSGVPESFHPNIAGYKKLATDLAAAVANPALLVPPYKYLLDPRPGTPNAIVARELLSLFPPGRTTYNGAGYARNQFNKNNTSTDWITWPAAYASCTTRILVLHRDNEAASPPPGLCDLTGASWTPPYDALPISTSNQSTPIDHVVPLKDAWANGAAGWTLPMRVDFANDLYSVQLIPASGTTNSKKNDYSIEQWQPPNRGYWCTYAEMWVAIKYQWNLAIDGTVVQAPATTDEWDWLNNELNSCPPLSP